MIITILERSCPENGKLGDDTNDLLVPYVQKINPVLTREFVHEKYLPASLGRMTSKTFWNELGLSDRYPEIEKDYLDTCLRLDPEFIEVAEDLSRQYRLAVLSNDLDEWGAYLRKSFGLDRLFAATVISGSVGYRKPDGRIYDLLLEKLGLPASQCVFIDDRDKNLQVAAAKGLKTIRFVREPLMKEFQPDGEIRSFKELPELLGRICIASRANDLPEELLLNWDTGHLSRIAEVEVTVSYEENRMPNVWAVGDRYILKRFRAPAQMECNIRISKALDREGIPVAVPVKTISGEDYVIRDGTGYCLYPRITGKGLTDHFGGDFLKRAEYLGRIVGDLHHAFVKCEAFLSCSENNLFEEVTSWALPASEEFCTQNGLSLPDGLPQDYKNRFGPLHEKLPRQLIHRDVHGENLLFENEKLTGYVDFDLSHRNIRIFDPCYLSTGILAGCFEDIKKREKWPDLYQAILKGYDTVCKLSPEEKQAIPYVLCSIELIFIAYFAQNGYPKLAETNVRMLHWIAENRSRLVSE